MDPYLPVSTQYAPVYPLTTLASDMALNQEPGTADTKDPMTGNYDSLPPQVDRRPGHVVADRRGRRRPVPDPGGRARERDGKLVGPTDAAMAAAVKDMTVRPRRTPGR